VKESRVRSKQLLSRGRLFVAAAAEGYSARMFSVARLCTVVVMCAYFHCDSTSMENRKDGQLQYLKETSRCESQGRKLDS
jgi:hypothetical protein